MFKQCVLTLFSLLFCICFLVHAESDFDDWGDGFQEVELVESGTSHKNNSLSYWNEHFSGMAYVGYSHGSKHNQILSNIYLTYKEKVRDINFVTQMAYYNFKINHKALEHSSIERNVFDNAGKFLRTEYVDKSTEINDTIQDSQFKLRQAYLEFSPIDKVTISAGRQTIVWGQLDLISPVDILLPMGYNPTGFTTSKIDLRMPQTTFRAAYYPIENLEFTTYFFPFYEEGELFSLSSFNSSYLEDRTKPVDSEGEYPRIYLKNDLPKSSSYGLRGMWYHDNFTAGLTYYNGFFNFIPWISKTFVHDANVARGNSSTEYIAAFRERKSYFPIDAFGAELAIPIGQKTLKFEASILDFADNFDPEPEVFNNDDRKNLVEFINEKNGGDTFVKSKYMALYALGLDADFDRWFYNFYISSIQFYKNPKTADLINDYNNLSNSSDIVIGGSVYFPTVNIGRYFNEDKKGAFGVAVGFLTGSLGVVSYFGNEISESWRWNLSFEVLGAFSDFATLMRNIKGDGQTFIEPGYIEPKISFGLNYKI